MGFESILVANRGEIAGRILRTARRMGYRVIAVYSEADEHARHVQMADEAVCIGPAPASDSYLDIDQVMAAAKQSTAEAIHPGYGFLSENAEFASACQAAGIAFIGPPPEAIALMGNKAAAKRRMQQLGVPCIPGYHGEDQGNAALLAAAAQIGYPIMVKAAAGGGGRGMRLVEQEGDLEKALDLARSEALSAFGSDELILERAVIRPRHVEIQVLADAHGNTVHLGERDCSVQRRHQKILEEAPCPVMTPRLRAQMGQAAVDAAAGIGYRGAGTVEFLLAQDDQFYFMEMNTRLQVEHPVTEMVTGLDLVEQQIRIAEGELLGFGPDEVSLQGHAIEARLYAEDPASDFLPATGRIDWLHLPSGPGIRVDTGVDTGSEVTAWYDPMIAKIVAWGPDRGIALKRLTAALADTAVMGLPTNRDFLLDAIQRPAFADGESTTAFVADEYPTGWQPTAHSSNAAVAAVLLHRSEACRARERAVMVSAELMNWSTSASLASHFRLQSAAAREDARVHPVSCDTFRVRAGDTDREVQVLSQNEHLVILNIDGVRASAWYNLPRPRCVQLAAQGGTATWSDTLGQADRQAGASTSGRVNAPMHGLLMDVHVAPGDRVDVGDPLCMLEAMKMQHELCAAVAGTVTGVHFAPGTQVAAGDLLIEIEPGDNQ